MFETVLLNLKGYENPKKLVREFLSLVHNKGREAVLRQGRFKLDREKWVAGMTCVGMTKLTGRPWFIKSADPKDQTPDFRATSFDKIENGKCLIWCEVECEIVECPKNLISHNSINPEYIVFEHIEKAKLWKAYPQNFVLIIYSRFACDQFSLEKLSQLFCDYKPKFMEIWNLISISPTEDIYLLAKLFPDRLDVEVNYLDILNS
ncbi:MAG: hypothetical protein HY810_09215 [Candidatus Omnitrophica bacterium]|nr:hypothetical protein [Candidatus Omnitrophota bacterium]